MFHSALVSEPLAWAGGVLIGCAGAGIAHLAGLSPAACVGAGSATAVVASLVLGVPINAATFDVLSLLVLRPLTGYGVWEAVSHITRGIGGIGGS